MRQDFLADLLPAFLQYGDAISMAHSIETRLPFLDYRLVEMANRYGFSGNLWCNYLTYLLVNKENAFSTSCEIVGHVDGSINQMAKHDFVRFKELFDFDIRVFDQIFCSGDGAIICDYKNTDSPNKLFNQRIRSHSVYKSRTNQCSAAAS